MYVYMNIHPCIHVYISVYTQEYTPTHTHTHTHTQSLFGILLGHGHVPILIFFFRLLFASYFFFPGTLSFYWVLAVQKGGIPGMIFLVRILKSPLYGAFRNKLATH
jgi:hypothetical protein